MTEEKVNHEEINYAELSGFYKGMIETLNYNLEIFELLGCSDKRMEKFKAIIAKLTSDQ